MRVKNRIKGLYIGSIQWYINRDGLYLEAAGRAARERGMGEPLQIKNSSRVS
jgi:hypothetical protein